MFKLLIRVWDRSIGDKVQTVRALMRLTNCRVARTDERANLFRWWATGGGIAIQWHTRRALHGFKFQWLVESQF